ncbi:MAG: MoxR family ATPase [Bacillota bacterium]|nr:MoxR family ATPase [Bacillota bacterium]
MNEIHKILANVSRVIIGKEDKIKILLAAIFSNGHILIEDVPGTGKTTLAKAIAKSLGCTFKRIQFTPDLMPSDIIGLSVYDKHKDDFIFKPGPVLSQFILADEINRTSPKTQSALLEAMAEKQVTVDGFTHLLPVPFIVIATQNPIEYEGTYPLPEAQLDRFMLSISIGYPDPLDEQKILKLQPGSDLLLEVDTVIQSNELISIQEKVTTVHISMAVEEYIVKLTQATRIHPDILLGISPRGSQYLYSAARGFAFLHNREYVLPDDIKMLVIPVFSHRLILKPQARLKGKTASDVLGEILDKTQVPVSFNVTD